MTSLTVTEARAALPDILSRVDGGEEITITRHGRPVAVVLRPDALRSRRAQSALADASRVHELMEAARSTALSPAGLSEQRAEEMIREIRAGREST